MALGQSSWIAPVLLAPTSAASCGLRLLAGLLTSGLSNSGQIRRRRMLPKSSNPSIPMDRAYLKLTAASCLLKFTITQGGIATCQLPPATISLKSAGGMGSTLIDESTYLLASDSGSNFRIDTSACQYVYNLATSSLGTGTYVVSISIAGSAVGSGTFGLQ